MNQFQQPLSKHDAEVLRIAANLKNEGYFSVKVDLPGCLKPDAIDGFYPDIQAGTANSQKEWITLIVEVETEDSVRTEHSKAQIAAFRKKERENRNTRFELHTVK